MSELNEIRSVKNKHKKKLLKKKNVVSCGIGYKTINGEVTEELCIVVGVSNKESLTSLDAADVLPSQLDSFDVDVVEIGVPKALVSDKFRPAPGGASIGHIDITAGTLGCIVERDNEIFILSNNHVLADTNEASIGDTILQPGPSDGGKIEDKIAELEDFIPIDFESDTTPPGCRLACLLIWIINFTTKLTGSDYRLQLHRPKVDPNLVDAAIARPLKEDLVTSEIRLIGIPTGTATIGLGDVIKKSGRTTNLTTGSISQIDVTVQVQYGAGKIATFEDQLMAGDMSAGGDSGSVALDSENRVVGLLFAGSDTTTIFNSIGNVLQALGITIKIDEVH